MNEQPKTEQKGITRKVLMRETGAPPYIVSYYRDCGRLPIVRPSRGPGYPILYHPDAIEVLHDLMRGKL